MSETLGHLDLLEEWGAVKEEEKAASSVQARGLNHPALPFRRIRPFHGSSQPSSLSFRAKKPGANKGAGFWFTH